MNKKSDSVSDEWLDFFVASSKTHSSAQEYYQSFKVYKEKLASLPKRDLVDRGWLNSTDDKTSLLGLFRDIHDNRSSVLYRKLNSAESSLSALWTAKVRERAEIDAVVYGVGGFHGITREQLKDIAKMSVDVSVLETLPEILRSMGIVLIFERSFKAMKLDGAVFKIDSGNPVVGMSLRYSRLDYFWFTLLHELSHICLHMDILESPIMDDLDLESDSDIETSANRLAKRSFVDRHVWRNCPPKYNKGYQVIKDFADDIGIHKSIVAGLLRKEEGNYSAYSKIVNEFNTREIIFGHD